MKRKILLVATIVSLVAIVTFGTLAFFTAEDEAHNVITTGNIDIELEEWMLDSDDTLIPYPKEKVSGVMPGVEISKIVRVRNTGSNSAYVRIKVEKSIELADKVLGKSPDLTLVKMDFDLANWIVGADGFYYYDGILGPGDITEPLFTVVAFDSDMGNIYQNSTATVDVTAYAVQSDNNGATVLEATGWLE